MDDTLDDILKWAQLKTMSEEKLANLEWALEVRPIQNLKGMSVIEAAVLSGVVNSKGEAKRMIIGNALFMNFRKITDQRRVVSDEDIIRGRVLFRVGGQDFGMLKLAE